MVLCRTGRAIPKFLSKKSPVWIPLNFGISEKLNLLRFLNSIIYTVWIRKFMGKSGTFGSLAGFWNVRHCLVLKKKSTVPVKSNIRTCMDH